MREFRLVIGDARVGRNGKYVAEPNPRKWLIEQPTRGHRKGY